MSSWEYYQQEESGTNIPYMLWWVCGMANASKDADLPSLSLIGSRLYALPFDVMRNVRVSKMAINLTATSTSALGRVRLGIYQNFSSTINFPRPLVVDAGEIDVSATIQAKVISGLNAQLTANTRYWAVFYTNASVDGASVRGLHGSQMIHIGALGSASFGTGAYFNVVNGLLLGSQTLATLPANFPTVDWQALSTSYVFPQIALAFNSVT